MDVVIVVKSGEKYEGLLCGSNVNNAPFKLSLKMVRKLQPAQVNGSGPREAALVGASPEHVMNFDWKDVADLSIPEFAAPEASKTANGL